MKPGIPLRCSWGFDPEAVSGKLPYRTRPAPHPKPTRCRHSVRRCSDRRTLGRVERLHQSCHRHDLVLDSITDASRVEGHHTTCIPGVRTSRMRPRSALASEQVRLPFDDPFPHISMRSVGVRRESEVRRVRRILMSRLTGRALQPSSWQTLRALEQYSSFSQSRKNPCKEWNAVRRFRSSWNSTAVWPAPSTRQSANVRLDCRPHIDHSDIASEDGARVERVPGSLKFPLRTNQIGRR